MKTTAALALVTLSFLCVSPAYAVTFDWATVGNPGNAADTEIMDDGTTGYGSVDYTYRISKHEVTNAQYTEFLNAVDPTGANANLGGGDGFLYHPYMSSVTHGGINFNGGAANGSKYEVKPGRDKNPVVYVSFFDAMRFTNWLENGQGTGDTESGVYTIGGPGLDEVRNPSAKFWIPSEDEWYKAAYHRNDGVTGSYWDYPTRTDTTPFSDNPSSLNTPDNSNVANFFKFDGADNDYDDGYAVTGSIVFDESQNYFTDVGAYSLAASPYGTFDQGGNVWEWNEAVIETTTRGLRSGDWATGFLNLHAMRRNRSAPGGFNAVIGFRVAGIPEPSTVLLGALAGVGVVAWRGTDRNFNRKRG